MGVERTEWKWQSRAAVEWQEVVAVMKALTMRVRALIGLVLLLRRALLVIFGEVGWAKHGVRSRTALRVAEERVGVLLLRPMLWKAAAVVGAEVIWTKRSQRTCSSMNR